MKYYVLKNTSNANGWDMFPAGETINYTLSSETLSIPLDIELDSMIIGYRSAPKDKFYSIYKVKSNSHSTLVLEKELEVNGGASISEVREEVRELIESDYSGIFEIDREDYEHICKSMFICANTDFVGNTGVCRNKPVHNSKEISNPFRPYITAIKSKPFLLLAGISGTGKSRIVRELARACWDKDSEEYKAQKPRNFEMVQVKPNWHDSSELIGYVSRVSGEPVYVAGAFLKFIARAWAEPDIPYFLCLDEMNLAPVEQYFAEYLSVIESRKNEDNIVVTDSILPAAKMKGPGGAMILQIWYSRLVEELLSGCPKTKEQDLRNQFINEGISIPQNLIVIGTVNMDETTFSFSRKVLDRAMTIEMNEVDLKGGLTDSHENIGKLGAEELIGTAVEGKDVYSENKEVCDEAIAYLQKVNDVSEGTPFKIAYRTRNEVLLYVVNNLPYNKDDKGEAIDKNKVIARALDEITSMKILSRIEGDESKVSKEFLDKLKQTIKDGLETVFDGIFDEGDDAYTSVSLTKLDEMTARLDSGHTSFWS